MPSLLDYAQLSLVVYDDVRNTANQALLPVGWTDQSALFNVGGGPSWNGFSAGVYKNGNDIVISFEGTDPALLSTDGAVDWLLANVPLAFGAFSPQELQAALLYERVKQQYGSQYHISFTGHSLGGGLASLMSTMFNQPATTFDPAPFANAINTTNLTTVAIGLAAASYFDSDLAALIATSLPSPPPILVNPAAFNLIARQRQSLIHNYALNGEVLATVRQVFPYLGPTPTVIPLGDGQLTSVQNHSISLLLAAQNVESFSTATQLLPTLLPSMFDPSLYAKDVSDPNVTKLDFLERLVQ